MKKVYSRYGGIRNIFNTQPLFTDILQYIASNKFNFVLTVEKNKLHINMSQVHENECKEFISELTQCINKTIKLGVSYGLNKEDFSFYIKGLDCTISGKGFFYANSKWLLEHSEKKIINTVTNSNYICDLACTVGGGFSIAEYAPEDLSPISASFITFADSGFVNQRTRTITAVYIANFLYDKTSCICYGD